MTVFNIVRLANHKALVTGTKKQRVVLDASAWDEVMQQQTFDAAREDYDRQVENFFAPLTDAADTLEEKLTRTFEDPAFNVVISEAVDEVKGEQGIVVTLDEDSAIVRLIWVGNDAIAITEAGFDPLDNGLDELLTGIRNGEVDTED